MNCPRCQHALAPNAQACSNCGNPLRPYGAPAAPQGDSTGGIIPYKNAPALIGYYLGIFSLLPFIGIPLGIIAFILGILGLKKSKTNPHVKGKVHAYVALICGGGSALVWLSIIAFIVFNA